MDKRIVYPNGSGGIAIVTPAPDARERVKVSDEVVGEDGGVTPAVWRDETDDEFVQRIVRKDVPAGSQYRIVEASDLPADRTFRAAWEFDFTDAPVNGG